MAKSSDTKSGKSGSKSGLGAASDKLAELAQNPLARSMLAAGLVTAAAALTANQKVRKGAKKASRDALDGAEAAADNASKVGTAILTAATDAVKRFMASATGGGSDAAAASGASRKSAGGKKSSAPKASGRKSATKSNGKSASRSTKASDGATAAKPARASSRRSAAGKASAAKAPARRGRTKPSGGAGA